MPTQDAMTGSLQAPPGEELPPTLGQTIVRWVRNATVAAAALSLCIHAIAWLLSAFILVGHGPGGKGEGDPGAGAIEMAILSQGDLKDIEAAGGLSLETPSVAETLPQVDVELKNITDPGEGPGESGAVSVSDVGPLAGGGDVGGGDGLGLGGSGGGGGGGASFFGVEARGNRFAYIVDVSGSMEGGRIQGLQRELDRSVEGLLETSEFQIVQYSTDAKIVTDRDSWNQASPTGKRSAHAHIGLLVADGSTNPLPAFEIVFKLRPRPDAIYFLTDGEFGDDVAERIITVNRQLKIPIHCICLESREGESRMKQIAKMSKGTYTYIPPKN